jgi:hypothetical protein
MGFAKGLYQSYGLVAGAIPVTLSASRQSRQCTYLRNDTLRLRGLLERNRMVGFTGKGQSFFYRTIAMTNLRDRVAANIDVALENVCRGLPNAGGDHETRKHIAKKLLQAARRGETTLGGFEGIARRALHERLHPKKTA